MLELLQYAHLLWGLALFVGVALYAYWPSRKGKMREYGAMILNDDSERGSHVAKH
jgi:cbb3-type cytochrome oxidase subunit 3